LNNIQPKTLFIGKNCIYLPSCHSTNDFAAEMIQKGEAFDGTIVITDNQTAGRGQRGNAWLTLPGQNITASFILKPNFLTANEQFKLNIAISLAVHHFLNNYLDDEDLKVKWPNDIYFGYKKLGGILIENTISGSQISYAIIGIGLNINQLAFENDRATSLKLLTQNPDFDLEKLIVELCESIEKYYFQLKNGGAIKQKELYLKNLFRYQEKHCFMKKNVKFLGQIIGIDALGRLALEIDGKIEYFDFKEIAFIVTDFA
jgi:BirA family transcriptional regulator, biotin operon repressor / biotin---[acetyl-CoA-carboxylase] ligase